MSKAGALLAALTVVPHEIDIIPIVWRFPNHRLAALADGMVTFRWRDSAHTSKKRLMTLLVNDFLRRFLLQVLPPGFVRIRHFGLMANRHPPEASPEEKPFHLHRPLWTCP